jgi:hypothetical protein
MARGNTEAEAGKGVDSYGRPVIDPTKNVLDLVMAESKYQDSMRDAETRRINDLAALRVHYDTIIEHMRSTNLNSTSTLLATQLREVKTDLSDRTSKLEQFRWETGGRGTGRADVFGYIASAGMFGAAIAAIVTFFLLKQ